MRILTRKEFQDDLANMWSEAVHAEYKAQIEAAVLAEREACADMLEHGYIDDEGHHLQYAKEIRARGNT